MATGGAADDSEPRQPGRRGPWTALAPAACREFPAHGARGRGPKKRAERRRFPALRSSPGEYRAVGLDRDRPPSSIHGRTKMRVMVIVKATRNSEAGLMPSEKLLADMGR